VWVVIIFVLLIFYFVVRDVFREGGYSYKQKIPTSLHIKNALVEVEAEDAADSQLVDAAVESLEFEAIDSHDFYGLVTRSADGRYKLAFGQDEDGRGRYLLLLRNKVIVEGRLANPGDGSVSNCGKFVLNDNEGNPNFTRDRDKLSNNYMSNNFIVFAVDGSRVLSCRTKASGGPCGISNSGRFAFSSTYRSHIEDHSNKIFFYDLDQEKILWAVDQYFSIGSNFEFDEKEGSLRLAEAGSEKLYSYRLEDGRFLDEERYVAERVCAALQSQDTQEIQSAFYLIKQTRPAAENMAFFEKVKDFNLDPGLLARLFRYAGEIYEESGEVESALQHYEIALTHDPKVGLKRKVDKLKKNNF
jgi:hypothetical protein